MAGNLDNGSLTPDQQLEAIYVAYFNRAGDSGGFSYWEGEYSQLSASGLNTDQVLSAIAGAFAQSGEAQTLYPFLTISGNLNPNSIVEQAEVAQFVANVYQNLFERTVPTTDSGVQYWTTEILSGAISVGDSILAIANGAQGTDAQTLNNKVTVATDFTTLTAAAGQGFGQAPPAYYAEAHASVAGTTSSPSSIPTQEATINAYLAGTASQTLTLTPGVDTLSATGPNAAFSAPLAVVNFNFVNTLQTGDSVTGTGTGNSLVATIDNAQGIIEPTLKDIQTLTVTPTITGANGAAAVTMDLSLSDNSISTINITTPTNGAGGFNINNIQSAPSAINVSNDLLSAANGPIQLTIAPSALTATTTNTLTLSQDTAGTNITIAAAGALTAGTGFLTETINSIGGFTNTPGVITVAGEKTFVIEGSANLTFTDGNTTTTTVNAATSSNVFTGTLNYTSAADGNVLTLTGGSGNNDVFNISAATAGLALDVINGGSGTGETLAVKDAQAITITGADANITNIQALTLTTALAGTVNTQWFGTSDTTLNLFAASAITGGSVVNFATSSAAAPDTLNVSSDTLAAAATLTVNVGTVLTTSDVLNIAAGSATAAAAFDPASIVTVVGAETINMTGNAVGGQTETFGIFTDNPTIGAGILNISGPDGFTFGGVVTAGVINASGITGGASLHLGAFPDALAGANVIVSGTGTTTSAITGSASGADVIVGGGVTADFITLGSGTGIFVANHGTGILAGATEGDTILLGTGLATVGLLGDAADSASATATALTDYAVVPHVANFIVGATSATSDHIVLGSAAANDYANGAIWNGGGAGVAAGAAPVVQNVPQGVGTIAATATENILKVTTGVAEPAAGAGPVATMLINALGGTQVTEATGHNFIVTIYDTTASKMDILDVNTGAGTHIGDAVNEVVHLIGTVDMTAANYANISANHFGPFAA